MQKKQQKMTLDTIIKSNETTSQNNKVYIFQPNDDIRTINQPTETDPIVITGLLRCGLSLEIITLLITYDIPKPNTVPIKGININHHKRRLIALTILKSQGKI